MRITNLFSNLSITILAVIFGLTCNGLALAQQAGPATTSPPLNATPASPAKTADGETAPATAAASQPVPLKDNVATISPANTQVNFVGTHLGAEPNPRLGGFRVFNGELVVDPENQSLKSLTMEFTIDSLWTEVGDKLTNHLKAVDFLDVANYPTAKFSSTEFKPGSKAGDVEIIGDFTLHGQTQSITLPATVAQSEQGVMLTSEFSLDRTSFGISEHADKVAAAVSIQLKIGQPTQSAIAPTTPSGPNPGGSRGNFDPTAMFKQQDANGDGKLTGDEIPEMMKQRMDAFDTDQDGSISLEEIQARIKARMGQGK